MGSRSFFFLENHMNIKINSIYTRCDVREMDFIKTHYEACLFLATDLSSMVLATQFRKCQFGTSNLVRARLHKAKFILCSFRNADLSEAVFDDATFIDCDFTGATFRRAVGLRGSNFLHCKGLDKVKGVKFKHFPEFGTWKIDDSWCVRDSRKQDTTHIPAPPEKTAPKMLGPAPKSENPDLPKEKEKPVRALPIIDRAPKTATVHYSDWGDSEDYWDYMGGVHHGRAGNGYNYAQQHTPLVRKKASLFCSNPDEYESYGR